MKKYISIILAVVLSICGLSACGQAHSNQTTEKDEKQIKVVTTIFPEYDWVREIAGDESDHVDLTMLLDNGGSSQLPADIGRHHEDIGL